MNFRQIEAFRAVMIAGSATTAGKMLYVSQPAISRLIKSLEETVGFKLFERRGNRLVPSAEGRRLYAEVERTFIRLEHIAEVANVIRAASSGTLRVAATPLIMHSLLPRTIKEFLRSYPDVSVEMTQGSRKFVIDCVASQVFDLAIETPPIYEVGVEQQLLTKQSAMCVLHRAHPLAAKDAVRARDLNGIDFIAPDADSIFRFQVDQMFKRSSVEPKIRVATATQKSICQLAALSIGVGIVTPFVIQDAVGLPLAFRPFRPEIPIEYSLLFPATRSRSIITERFVGLLRRSV